MLEQRMKNIVMNYPLSSLNLLSYSYDLNTDLPCNKINKCQCDAA